MHLYCLYILGMTGHWILVCSRLVLLTVAFAILESTEEAKGR